MTTSEQGEGRMYWEDVDQVVEIGDACADLCGLHERPGHWDRNKLQAVAGLLRYLSYSRELVRFHVDGAGEEQIAKFVAAAADILSVRIERVGPPEAEVDLHIDLHWRGAPVPLKRMEAFVRRLSLGGLYFCSHWDDVWREDSVLSRSRLREAMWTHGALPVFESYFAGFEKVDTSTFEAQQRLRALRPEPMTGGPQQFLFVLGHARGGTSLLFQLLNDQPDIFVAYEANSYLVKNRYEFVANFNARAGSLGRKRSKGFVMLRAAQEDSVAAAYRSMLSHYRLVGEKLAFGPRLSSGHAHHADLAFDYLSAYFPFARYLLVARRPRASVAAIARIMPQFSVHEILECWMATVDVLLRCALNLPAARFISFDRLTAGDVRPVAALIGAEIKQGLTRISRQDVSTQPVFVDDFWRERADEATNAIADEAESFYECFCALFGESGDWAIGVTHYEIDLALERLSKLRRRLMP